ELVATGRAERGELPVEQAVVDLGEQGGRAVAERVEHLPGQLARVPGVVDEDDEEVPHGLRGEGLRVALVVRARGDEREDAPVGGEDVEPARVEDGRERAGDL